MWFRKLFSVIVALVFIKIGIAAKYELVFENDQIFDTCPEGPNLNGLHDLLDISELSIVYNGENISVSGNATCVWKGVEPTDRIEVSEFSFLLIRRYI